MSAFGQRHFTSGDATRPNISTVGAAQPKPAAGSGTAYSPPNATQGQPSATKPGGAYAAYAQPSQPGPAAGTPPRARPRGFENYSDDEAARIMGHQARAHATMAQNAENERWAAPRLAADRNYRKANNRPQDAAEERSFQQERLHDATAGSGRDAVWIPVQDRTSDGGRVNDALWVRGGGRSMVFPTTANGKIIDPATNEIISRQQAQALAALRGSASVDWDSALSDARTADLAYVRERDRYATEAFERANAMEALRTKGYYERPKDFGNAGSRTVAQWRGEAARQRQAWSAQRDHLVEATANYKRQYGNRPHSRWGGYDDLIKRLDASAWNAGSGF
jgi:hypothetical protein